jgi:hypothetical protein
MPTVIVKHTVQDYATWKKVFDTDAVNRETVSTGGRILRSADNANELTIILHVKHLGKAKEWAHDPKLKETMQGAGVTSVPDIRFYEDGESFTV